MQNILAELVEEFCLFSQPLPCPITWIPLTLFIISLPPQETFFDLSSLSSCVPLWWHPMYGVVCFAMEESLAHCAVISCLLSISLQREFSFEKQVSQSYFPSVPGLVFHEEF